MSCSSCVNLIVPGGHLVVGQRVEHEGVIGVGAVADVDCLGIHGANIGIELSGSAFEAEVGVAGGVGISNGRRVSQ